MEFQNKFTTQNLQKYLDFLKAKGNSSSSIQRKLSSIASFENFLIKKQLIKFVKPVVSTSEQIKKKSNFNTILTRYLIFGSLIALFLGLVYSLYQQSLIKTRQNLAYSTATSPVKPTRILSFQGRLTDSVGNPITSSTPINFKLFDSSSAGTQLYDSSIGNSQSITPDENGIFNVIIGKTHGSEISQDVFSENPEVWLQITTGSEVMNPRQQIATVAYAINSETLQGLPPSSYGLKNTVLVIDNQGNLNLGETSPSIKSNSGTFTLEGQGVVIKTATSSNGNINFLPDGGGGVNFNSQATAPTSGGFVNFYNPSISSGNIFNSQILNTNRGYNFLSFQNYDIGTSNLSTRFSVGASGNVLANSLLLNQTLSVGSTALATNLNADLLDGFDSSYFNYNSVYYVEGNTTGVGGTWTGNLDNLANYYNGLKIAYKIGIKGASTTRLDINGLGPVVVRRNNANLTTHLPVEL